MHQDTRSGLPLNDQEKAQGKGAAKPREWTPANVAAIAEKLEKVPPPAPRLTTAQAVEKLLPQVKKLRQQGHSLDSISAHLGALGLPVAARTLARALAGAKAKPRAGKRAA